MAGVINTGTSPKALWPGLKVIWGRNYTDHSQEWADLVDKTTSDKAYEEGMSMTPFGLAPIKPEGSSIQYDSEQQGFVTRITNVAYALGYIVTREEMDDNQYPKIAKQRTASLARSFRQTKENVVANMYNRGFNTSYVGGDGVTLFNVAHPSPLGGTAFSNKLAVDADLSEASLEDINIQIMGAVDDRGLKIGLNPTKLIIPINEVFNAQRILKSVQQSGTANNDINALRSMSVIPSVASNHFLTSAHAWFVRTDIQSGQGLVLQERVGAEFDEDNEFDTKNMKYAGYERYGVGWFDPRGAYGSNGP